MMADATGVNRCPRPARMPRKQTTISETEVVISGERLLRMAYKLINTMNSRQPTAARSANWSPSSEPSIPSSEVMAKVRTPISLCAHSRSSPTRNPTPSAIAIFTATSVGGNRCSICMMRKQSYSAIAAFE